MYKKFLFLAPILLAGALVSCALIEPPDLENTVASSSSSSSSPSASSSSSTSYSFTVIYNSEGGSAVGSQTVNSPNTTVGTVPFTTYTGKTFGGWYTAPNGGGSEFTGSTTVSANITVYAFWNSLILVPAGTFQYDGNSGDTCTVPALHMSEYDITGSEFSAVTGLPDPSYFSGVATHPVEQVTWYDALVFCNDLSIKEGLTPVYTISGNTSPSAWGTIPTSESATWDAVTANWSASGYRLPTEMEYMWVAMGDTSDARSGDIALGTNTGGYTKGYAGSTEAGGAQVNIGNYAWYSVNDGTTTKAVGTKLPNELGLYDISGNVWQWIWDAWDSSTGYNNGVGGPVTDPTYNGQAWASGFGRVIRGGSWHDGASYITVAFRNGGVGPYSTFYHVGFRVVRP